MTDEFVCARRRRPGRLRPAGREPSVRARPRRSEPSRSHTSSPRRRRRARSRPATGRPETCEPLAPVAEASRHAEGRCRFGARRPGRRRRSARAAAAARRRASASSASRSAPRSSPPRWSTTTAAPARPARAHPVRGRRRRRRRGPRRGSARARPQGLLRRGQAAAPRRAHRPRLEPHRRPHVRHRRHRRRERFDNAVRFKAHEVLPIAMNESVLDYRVLGDSVDENGEATQARAAGRRAPRPGRPVRQRLPEGRDPARRHRPRGASRCCAPSSSRARRSAAQSRPRSSSSRSATSRPRWSSPATASASSPASSAGAARSSTPRSPPRARSTPLEASAIKTPALARRRAAAGHRRGRSREGAGGGSHGADALRRASSSPRSSSTRSSRIRWASARSSSPAAPRSSRVCADALHTLVGVPVRAGDPLGRVVAGRKFDSDPTMADTLGSLSIPIGLGIDDDAVAGGQPAAGATRRPPTASARATPQILVPAAVAVPGRRARRAAPARQVDVSDKESSCRAAEGRAGDAARAAGPGIDLSIKGEQARRAAVVADVLARAARLGSRPPRPLARPARRRLADRPDGDRAEAPERRRAAAAAAATAASTTTAAPT